MYASRPSSPAAPQHSLEGGSLLPYPHRTFTGWKAPASLGALRTALHALDDDLTDQSDWLVNYAERHRAGLRVRTAVTEGTANFLVNRRMYKSHQMRWSRRGADLLLRARCAVYNGTLGSGFGQRFQPANDPHRVVAIAA